MAGIYVHVPFCKTRCIYCDFFTRTDMGKKNPYIAAICQEIALRSHYLDDAPISTIYFGGGTPSQLNKEDLRKILNSLHSHFQIDSEAEITLEANPDDLSERYIYMLLDLGFNRLSMGIQSFDDRQLTFLNRRHSASKAIEAVRNSQKLGFDNISIDLMYGLPNLTLDEWKKTLNTAISLNVQHISSYHLIYEEGTRLYRQLQNGRVQAIDEDSSLEMFTTLIEKLAEAGFEHYEISNFARNGLYSRHNSSYWLNEKYLGLGPSAHSYNKVSRCWNVSSIPRYLEGIQTGNPCIEEEMLSVKEKYNDYVLTGMRTQWGVNISGLQERFGDNFKLYFQRNIQKHLDSQVVLKDQQVYKLSSKGIFISDGIMSDLMYID